MDHLGFVITRLWRYFGLYFLKPFDAVNDTLTASLIRRLDWEGRFLEIGSGDGFYSYVLHGGAPPLWFDRYLMTDLSRADIYDVHRAAVMPTPKPLAWPTIVSAIDAKMSHVAKIREIGFARGAVCAHYEGLPIRSGSIDAIFFYTPHGLKDHAGAIDEAHRVLRKGGRMLILLYDSRFSGAFLCHRLAGRLKGWPGRYFERLDNGRHGELTHLSKTLDEWHAFFARHGFRIRERHAGLSRMAWMVYDTQTRPILKPLIRGFNALPGPLRTAAKVVWMSLWFPWLLAFYLLFSNEYVKLDSTSCYLSYEVERL